ncbi:MAG: hypothetical protein U0936_12395 [Planctomycetaceae bacterium]
MQEQPAGGIFIRLIPFFGVPRQPTIEKLHKTSPGSKDSALHDGFSLKKLINRQAIQLRGILQQLRRRQRMTIEKMRGNSTKRGIARSN